MVRITGNSVEALACRPLLPFVTVVLRCALTELAFREDPFVVENDGGAQGNPDAGKRCQLPVTDTEIVTLLT